MHEMHCAVRARVPQHYERGGICTLAPPVLRLVKPFALAALFFLAFTAEGAIRAEEKQKIEALIAAVETLPDATFVRNGKAYPPATAAKFLRGKWERHAREIATAGDFIDKVASRSSTTGRPYLVRFRDGREIPTAEFLRAELRRLH